jgi:CRISPR/Cas system-associated exonuclease Cas4 (RecB family)
MADQIIEIDEQKSLKISEYNGKYKLVAMYNGYEQWGKRKVSKTDYADKDTPIAVPIGDDKEEAIETMIEAIKKLIGDKENTIRVLTEALKELGVDTVPF